MRNFTYTKHADDSQTIELHGTHGLDRIEIDASNGITVIAADGSVCGAQTAIEDANGVLDIGGREYSY